MTGNEASLDAWRARVEDVERRLAMAGRGACLHELRLDALAAVDDTTWSGVGELASRTVACLRPTRQGGAYAGPESTRLALLERIADAGVAWLDVEADVPPEWLATLQARLARARSRTKLLLSHHDFEGVPHHLPALVAALGARGADAVKLAVRVSDASEIAALVDACRALERPRVVVAMGEAGLLSRSHYAALGSAFTYVAAEASRATAPGQLDLGTALAMGMPESARHAPFALAGGPQVMRSPGLVVHNRLLRRRADAASYVPVVTRSLAATLPLLERLGVRGLAVTMPLKREALACSFPDALATEVGAVNSLRWRERREGTNTDVEGIRGPLATFVARGGLRRAVVLGSGGAARAAAVACRSLGLAVEVCARSLDDARAIAGERGRARRWDLRAEAAPLHDAVLLNATPITGEDSPWPEDAPLDAAVLFDTALGDGSSRLLARAAATGLPTLDPLAMWYAQAARQMSWLLDARVDVRELEEASP